jgi:hypothetical protein
MAKKLRPNGMRTSCPNCLAEWAPGSEEWDWQKCDSCGWPDSEESFDEDYDPDYNNDDNE